jgi:hypothetical protein
MTGADRTRGGVVFPVMGCSPREESGGVIVFVRCHPTLFFHERCNAISGTSGIVPLVPSSISNPPLYGIGTTSPVQTSIVLENSMLTALKDMKVTIVGERPAPLSSEETSAIEAFLETDPIMASSFDAHLRDDLHAITAQLTTIDDLIALKQSIEKYGMTRSLLSFANHNNLLSTAITAIPSLESLTSDRSVKNSQDVVVALEGAIGERLEIFFKTIKARFENFLKHFKRNEEHLHKYVVRMQVLGKMIDQGRTFDDDKAKKRMIVGHPYVHLIEQLENVHRVVDVSEKIVHQDLPFTFDAYNTWHEKMRALVGSISDLTHLHVTSNGQFGDDDTDNWTKKSLHEFGYDSIDKFHKMMPLLASVLKSVKMLNRVDWHIQDIHNDTYTITPGGMIIANSSMQYVREACEFIMTAIYHLYHWVADVGTAAYTAMKDIFSCTTKDA